MALGIISGRGALPGLLLEARPDAGVIAMAGTEPDLPPSVARIEGSFDRFGKLFDDLRAKGITEIIMAGGMDRPTLDPARFDAVTAQIAPDLLASFRKGDDALLRHFIRLFEEQGFRVIGAADAAPGLVAGEGLLAGEPPDAGMRADAARGWSILRALGALDLGQAAIVAGGLCLGVETLQGTDALIAFAGATPSGRRPPGGVLVKGPKPRQEMRVDMPAIGPDTIDEGAAAGLRGIALAAGAVLLLDRGAIVERAAARAVSVWAEHP